ncbi:hypothetical protein [Saccharomonospora xinjiangensis]|uniref:hypothetical protein n=1 Tax=Saccharomonospora xinjiangensis TaxID=75294 RepID=UPI0018DEE8B7|nr:hypothetical protein [Saccharomonospora xinjiangensis]
MPTTTAEANAITTALAGWRRPERGRDGALLTRRINPQLRSHFQTSDGNGTPSGGVAFCAVMGMTGAGTSAAG